MSQNNKIQRTQFENVDFEPGGSESLSLARSHYYQDIGLLIDYEVTPGAGAEPVDNGILDLIEDIEVRINGEKSVKSLGLATNHNLNWYRDASEPFADEVDWDDETEQTGTVQTDVNFLAAPGLYASLLPSFRYSTLDLRIKWANESDVATEIDELSATMTVESRERLRSTVNNGRPIDTGFFKENERRFQLNATGTNTLELPIGNRYHSIAVQILDENGEPTEDLVNGFKVVENGVETHADTTFSHLRADNFQDYNLERLADGFAIFNYGLRADLDDVVDSSGMDQFELKLNTDGQAPNGAEVRVVTRELV